GARVDGRSAQAAARLVARRLRGAARAHRWSGSVPRAAHEPRVLRLAAPHVAPHGRDGRGDRRSGGRARAARRGARGGVPPAAGGHFVDRALPALPPDQPRSGDGSRCAAACPGAALNWVSYLRSGADPPTPRRANPENFFEDFGLDVEVTPRMPRA